MEGRCARYWGVAMWIVGRKAFLAVGLAGALIASLSTTDAAAQGTALETVVRARDVARRIHGYHHLPFEPYDYCRTIREGRALLRQLQSYFSGGFSGDGTGAAIIVAAGNALADELAQEAALNFFGGIDPCPDVEF